MDLLEARGALTQNTAGAVIFGSVSAEDAAVFMEVRKMELTPQSLKAPHEYLFDPDLLPAADAETKDRTLRWFVLQKIRNLMLQIRDDPRSWQYYDRMTPAICKAFFAELSNEEKVTVMLNCVKTWGKFGADATLRKLFFDMTGIEVGAQRR